MNIHEYQAKALLQQQGISIVPGVLALSPEEAQQAAESLGGSSWVVKAQIHAGGRGKAGGIKMAKTLSEVHNFAKELLGKTLITPQTGKAGKIVHHLYIEKTCSIAQEFYLSLLLDRSKKCLIFIASKEGGTDIEEVSQKHPEKVLTLPIDFIAGVQTFHARLMARHLGVEATLIPSLFHLMKKLEKTFLTIDASLIEINPLVLTTDQQLIPLDAKITLDDNALYRHEDLRQLRDPKEEDIHEQKAHEYDLNYIKLDGTIGCMVNGAGLALATMDTIQLYGGSPANFLDVGAGATQDKVKEAFKIIVSDPHVKGILVNIFGGMMRCDLIAEGIVGAVKEIGLTLPLVIGLQGTYKDEGKAILQQSGLSITPVEGLDEAAKTIVALVKGQ
jgi:succinyl-CoA synthetase beta subunit